jgi:predicted ATPase
VGSDQDSQAVSEGAPRQGWSDEVLLDREGALASLDALLQGARAGYGRAVIVRGPAGIGKTRLLGELRRRAGEGGLTTLTARGGELERDFPFGCVRQLFESLIRRDEQSEALLSGDARLSEAVFAPPGDDERGPSPDPSYGVLHGLYWLTANLAEQGPLLLALDDAHWADPASLRYFSFLTRRLDGVPALVALTARPAEPGAESDLLRRLAHDPLTEVVDLAPLSSDSVATIVRAHLDGEVTERTTALCHQATRGNPFLLRELLREVEREVGTPGVVDLERIEELGPGRVAEAVTSRLERVGAGAPGLARSVAVLGDGAELRRAAALVELDPDHAAGLADALGSAGILEPGRPLRFAHPIVRNAVYGQMPPAERDRWHRRAASMLADAGESAETVSVHLLATEPAGRPGAVDFLRRAAESASSRGAPDSAVRFLERALAEPASPALRPVILSELGRNASWARGRRWRWRPRLPSAGP